jgi:type IV secretory pathway VirB10-like protein
MPSLFAAVRPELKQVNTVYILAMGNGEDQFLANQLASAGVFQVVTDPKKADAILTDRVGEPFEKKLDELYPPPPPPPPPAAVKKDDDKDTQKDEDKDAKKDDAKDTKPNDDAKRRALDLSGGGRVTSSSFNRGKGNFFLVDRKSRTVLWSVYEPAKDTTPASLTKVAAKVVKRLQADMADKKQGGE